MKNQNLIHSPLNILATFAHVLINLKHAFFFRVVAIVLLMSSIHVSALVNPENAYQPTPDWMARIYVINEFDGSAYLFCYGVLTDKQWVMSAGNCFSDPYYILDAFASQNDPEFEIRVGTSTERVRVSDFSFSDDSQLVMFQLADEVTNRPLAINTLTNSELLGQNVRIFAQEKSFPAGHWFYNPGGGKPVTCLVDGKEFSNGSGGRCYVFTYPLLADGLQQARAIVVDPKSPLYLATQLDKAVTVDTSGAKLYLNFKHQNSYPCMEDVGLPVIRTNSSGLYEMVGIVGSAGVSAGVPMCTSSIVNSFPAMTHYKDFIEKTMVAGDFKNVCPAPPELEVTYTGDNGIRLDWNEVSNADGYRLQYASRLGYSTIQTVEMLNSLTISTEIKPGLRYTVSIMAYNANCTSQLSDPIPVSIIRSIQ